MGDNRPRAFMVATPISASAHARPHRLLMAGGPPMTRVAPDPVHGLRQVDFLGLHAP